MPSHRARTAVVIPVGPGTALHHLQDTVDSVVAWIDDPSIVVVDDTGGLPDGAVRAPELDVVSTGVPGSGGWGGLHRVCGIGYQHVLDHVDADVLLKLDTDALVIGRSPDRDAVRRLASSPRTGILGSYRTMCTGKARGFAPAARLLEAASGRREAYLHPGSSAAVLRRLMRRARRNGYETGEHALGGAYFVSRRCLDALGGAGLLDLGPVSQTRCGEDHLIGLTAASLGFRTADFAVGLDPMGLAWRGLPMPAEELVAAGKKIVHSVSDWQEQREDELRAYFRTLRPALLA